MRNAGLYEAQAGIKIAGRNINNLRYANDATLMAESEEKLKSLLMNVKEENETIGLKLNLNHGIQSHCFMANRWGKMQTVANFLHLGSKITADGDCSHETKTLASWKKSYDKLRQCIKKQRHHFANKGPYR